MAASSSSQEKYDVFISFRGIDTRDNFTSHVYAALCRKKIQTFLDDDLERGDVVSDALLRTISESKISVIIFSENYASSRWCLDELAKIMECNKENGQIVLPVFFKVDPSHVRHQSGPFGQAFSQYKGDPKVQTWRDALTKAANLSGLDSRIIRLEATLVESIVTEVMRKLYYSQVRRPETTLVESIVTDIMGELYYTSSSSFGDLVGMSSRFQQIGSLLSTINKDVRIIGLWGMGGIGKTTLAREFFNHFFSRFEGNYFIGDIRETCEKRGLIELQKELVTGLLKDGYLNVGTPSLGIPFIRDRLRRMKVLIVFDNVCDFQHLELLVRWRDSLGPESVVLVTSRDKQLLQNGQVDAIYDVPELNYVESLLLFSRHAFRQEHPSDEHHMRLSTRAINYAQGHPLALKILSSHLYGKSTQYQESALRKLERTPENYLQKVLRISYDGLDHQQKNLFLSIACFFKGEYVDDVHDACGYDTDIELDVLIDKSLITIYDDEVEMHALLQEMGRQIVCEESIGEPGERSRLWDPNDIRGVLTQNTGTVAVKGISWHLSTRGHELISIHPAAFERMRNLEFLRIINMADSMSKFVLSLPHGLDSLPTSLRYLNWQAYPLTYLPSNFQPENLVFLRLSDSNVERLWSGRQNLPHLKEIYLSHSVKLIEAPDLSLATNLQKLDLTGCFLVDKFPEVSSLKIQYLYLGDTAIEEVPSTICNLKSLVELELHTWFNNKKRGHTNLYGSGLCFPLKKRGHQQQEVNIHLREFIDQRVWLCALEFLDLSRNNFQEISVVINQLTNLRNLILTDCRRLQSLPQLPMNIKEIRADNCISLEMVASPLSIAAGEVFDCHANAAHHVRFDFGNCCKLSQNGRSSIVEDVKSRLLHCKNYPKNKGHTWPEIIIPGDDVPDWFNYKSSGSSLTEKLPPHWCTAESLLFCAVFELKLTGWIVCDYNLHIKTNGGYLFCAEGRLPYGYWNVSDDIPSNHVVFSFRKELVNEWRKIPKGEDDAYEISIEFFFREYQEKLFTIKKCGVHLLYPEDTHDIKDRCRLSVVQPNFPWGDLTQLSLEQDCVDDVEESVLIQDAKDSGVYNDNSCNAGNPVEKLAPMPRRKKMKWKLNTFKFTKFLRVRRKSTQKVSRNNFKFKECRMRLQLQSP